MHLFSLRTLMVCFFGMYCLGLQAQIFEGAEAARILPKADKVWQDEANGALKYVRLQQSSSLPPGEGEGWLRDALKLRPEDRFNFYQRKQDQAGFLHYRYRQYYRGVPVLYGVYYLHYRGQVLHSANGEFYPNIQVNTTPSVDEAAALATAKASIPSAKAFGMHSSPLGPEPEAGELYVMVDSQQVAHLVYRFDIKVAAPFGRYWVMVDAHSGTVIDRQDRIHTTNAVGTAHTKYRGIRSMDTDSTGPNSFRMRDYTRAAGVETYDLNTSTNYASAIDFTDTDNTWDVTANQDDAANDCHWGTQWTYDYLLNEHNHDSYDGNGAAMVSYVHFGNNFLNAFWNGSVMTYGDGNGAGATALTSIDIVAHEILHGVTEFSAGLIYSYESGALNESFSDIFGVVVDFYTDSVAANWLMGDEIGFTFRNASDPNQFQHPDTYLGNFWWTSPGDNGGVHVNSGVQNFWFYLLTMGASGTNDLGNPYNVVGIGMESAADISYRNLTTYLTPNSQFADARFFAIQAADDLFGSCSQEVISTTNAWHAVGIGGVFNNAVQAGFNASQTFSCTVPATIDFYNNSFNGTTYTWDFGDGNTSTAVAPTHTYTATGTYTVELIANGTAICGNSDTLVQTNFITITNAGGPVSAACSPPSNNGGSQGAGIYQVDFNTISKSSNDGSDSYQDYTCTDQTTVMEGVAYPISVITGSNTAEDVKVWIDLDNDGSFNNTNELVYFSDNTLQTHQDTIIVPGGAVLNTSLRMRVGSDISNQALAPCTNPFAGQFEDYGIFILANTNPPAVDFTGTPLVVSP
ncbi:MAG: M4 family metallopeptidase, partial [Bacteroidota bacterium]